MGQNSLYWLLGIIVAAGLITIISSLNNPSRKLQNLTRKLSDVEITNEKANQLIGLLMAIKFMPKKTAYWASVKAAYGLIEQSGNVDPELKKKLRTLLHGLNAEQNKSNKQIS